MTDILPDCMMPDGSDPCAGFRQVYADHARLNAENLMLRAALEYARRFLRPEDHDVAFVDAALSRNSRDRPGNAAQDRETLGKPVSNAET
jgi:hypothetical protein